MNYTRTVIKTASLSTTMLATGLYAAQSLYAVIDLSGGPSASAYHVDYVDEVPAGGWTDEYKGDKLVLRLVPAGDFDMGSPEGEIGHNYMEESNNEPLHHVAISEPFYIGVFEVTQRQYGLVTGAYPSEHKGDFRPVDRVSYDDIRGNANGSSWPEHGTVDANSFLGLLQSKTDLNIDLPTEAQWEYACHAGMDSALNSGRDLENASDSRTLMRVGRYAFNQGDGKGDYGKGTTNVGSYEPNRWGIYDMHGNVAEWCLDWWSPLSVADVIDPAGPKSGDFRVVRGGFFGGTYFWSGVAATARSAFRSHHLVVDTIPSRRFPYFGFRVVANCPTNQ